MNTPFVKTITIPQKLAQKGDLVVIPRKEYEELKAFKRVREFSPTLIQKKSFLRAKKNFIKGKTLSYHELIEQLGITH